MHFTFCSYHDIASCVEIFVVTSLNFPHARLECKKDVIATNKRFRNRQPTQISQEYLTLSG